MATFSLLSFKSGKILRLSHGPVRAWQPSHSNFICSPDLYCRENFTNIHSGVYGSVFWYSTLLEGSVICIRRPPDRRPPPLNPQVTILSFSPSALCSWMSSQKHSGGKWVRHACNPLFNVTSEIRFLRYVWNPLFSATPEICFLPRCTYKRGFIWYTLSVILISNTMSGWILLQKYEIQKSMKVCDPKVHIKVCNLKSMCGMKSRLES